MNTYQSSTKVKTITTVVAIAVIIGIVILIEVLQHNATKTTASIPTSSSNTTMDSSGSTSTSGSSDTASSSTSTYKDGTYTADASYYVPHGNEDIKVTLTVANGVVTDSSIINSESDRDSERYQEDFAAEYKTLVVGKNLADIKLSYVAGASDTTNGFNDAMTQIRTQAQA